jgi:predicted RNase H-like HicB family nuclease
MRCVTLTAVLRKEAGMYVATCPELGTVSQGATVEEAVANLKEATELYLEESSEEISWLEADKPLVTTFEAQCALAV